MVAETAGTGNIGAVTARSAALHKNIADAEGVGRSAPTVMPRAPVDKPLGR
jgi:hypothetical protein